MTRATRTEPVAPAALSVTPRTNAGAGLLVPLAKALAHLMLISEASARDWPLTRAEANAEMVEACAHLNDVSRREGLWTDTLAGELAAWGDNLRSYAADFAVSTADNRAEPLAEDDKGYVQNIIRLTWQLMALIDREITGLDQVEADAGRMP